MAQAKPFGQVVLDRDDLRQFNAAVRRSTDSELPKRIGQANKSIGAKFVDEWLEPKPDPQAVGEGAGAAVRPSASKREVLLRVGGAHRDDHAPRKQWGKRVVRPFQRAPKRPHIRGSVARHEDDLKDAWLHAIADAMAPAFHDTEP